MAAGPTLRTSLLRAIGYGTDKHILDLFGLSEEVEANEGNLKKIVGRKLAARVLKTWTEDFVDEDTGEVVSIDRNEILLERDHLITEEDVGLISGSYLIMSHSMSSTNIDAYVCAEIVIFFCLDTHTLTHMINGLNQEIFLTGSFCVCQKAYVFFHCKKSCRVSI